MAVIACGACGGKMNDGLAVCPHCGARRALTERPKLSSDEIRALLVTDPTARDAAPRGLLQTLVLPHPATRGATRLAELVLTVLGLPLVVAGAVTIALTRRARLTAASGGELSAALAMTVFGGGTLLLQVPVALAGATIAAVWARALIRSRADARRGGDLHRIEPPHRERGPALPAARVIRDEPVAPGPESAAPPGGEPVAPRPEPPAPPGGEPRLLR